METKNITIKDIAKELGISSTTVHKVIYNKPGVGEKTKKLVNDYILQHDFQLNRAASALKRKAIQVAYVGINSSESDAFFYREIQEGLLDAYETFKAFNVELQIYNSEGTVEAQVALLERLFSEQRDTLDGLLLISAHEFLITPTIQKFTKAGIKVVTIISDARNSMRSAYICGNNTMAGRVAGELVMNLGIPENGEILLICGFRSYSNHQLITTSFTQLVQQDRPDVDIIELYQDSNEQVTEEKIKKYLTAFHNISSIYCVTARGTHAMCRVVQAMGLSGKIRLIGSDTFDELRPFFADRTLTATIFQNPRGQAARALSSVYELITMEKPVPEYQLEDIGIVIRSNLDCYL